MSPLVLLQSTPWLSPGDSSVTLCPDPAVGPSFFPHKNGTASFSMPPLTPLSQRSHWAAPTAPTCPQPQEKAGLADHPAWPAECSPRSEEKPVLTGHVF